jgi:hypothetical protein
LQPVVQRQQRWKFVGGTWLPRPQDPSIEAVGWRNSGVFRALQKFSAQCAELSARRHKFAEIANDAGNDRVPGTWAVE